MHTTSILDTKTIRLRRGLMIKTLREQRGLTQPQLARLIGVGQGRISDYERGEKSPSIDRLPVLAAALDIEIHDLVLIDDPSESALQPVPA